MTVKGILANRVIDMRFWAMYASGYISLVFGVYNVVVLTSLRFPQFNSLPMMVTSFAGITIIYLGFGWLLERKGFIDRDLKRQTMKNEELQMLGMLNNCYSRMLLTHLKIIPKCDERMQKLCREWMPNRYKECKIR